MILLLLLLLSSECLVTAQEFTITLGYRHIFVHCSPMSNKIQFKATANTKMQQCRIFSTFFLLVRCSLMNNKIQIKATTICINVEYLALLTQLKSVHRNNCTEQSLYWESIVTKVKLRDNFFNCKIGNTIYLQIYTFDPGKQRSTKVLLWINKH